MATVWGAASGRLLQGVEHLKRLQLIPDDFGDNMDQNRRDDNGNEGTGRKHPLDINTNFEFGSDILATSNKVNINGCVCGNGARPKVKSGKFVKSHINIIWQEVRPHTAVSRNYAKWVGFDQLEFDAFVAGESKIIHSMLCNDDSQSQALGRVRVLTLVAHWVCRMKNWALVQSLYHGGN